MSEPLGLSAFFIANSLICAGAIAGQVEGGAPFGPGVLK
jgi:hypothetical protein